MISTMTADKILDALCRGQAFTVERIYIQLHTGEPGRAGTSHRAQEVSRREITFAEPAAAKIRSDSDATWANIAGTEHATHFSAWDASSGGSFLFSGTIDAHPYMSGDTLTIPAGNLTSSIVVAQ